MTLLAEKDERFKNLFGKAVFFILLAVIGIGLVFLWAGLKKGAFTAKSPIYFVADSGQELSEGMPVKFSGFKIGKLHTLELDEQGHVQVEVAIETKYLGLLHQGAEMSLKKEGVIGDGVLDISRGVEDKPTLLAGDTVHFQRGSGLEQAVLDIKNRIVPILDDVQHMLSDPNGDVRQTLTNLREFSGEMRGTRQRIDQVLGSVDTSLNKDVGPLLRSLNQSVTKIDHDLPDLLNKAGSSMENLRITSESIKDAVQLSVPQLPGILGEARETLGKTREMVGSTQEVVDSLSTSWPLKSVVPAPETGPVRMDSHD